MTDAKLTYKQRAFLNAYVQCGYNATEAARRAGYSKETARQQGQRLLTNVDIQAELERRFAEQAMSADEVLARLAEQARGDMRDFVRTDADGTPTGFNLGPETPQHLIKKVTITEKGISFELYSAKDALELIGKHLKLFTEREPDPTPPVDWGRVPDAMQTDYLDGKIKLVDVIRFLHTGN